MRQVFLVGLAVTIGAGCPGCQFFHYGFKNLVHVPTEACDLDHLHDLNRKRAEAAWKEVVATHAGGPYSEAYACGFKEGYADYLNYGPRPGLPALPPFHYRLAKRFAHPPGHAAIHDWYAGFSHGVTLAAGSGIREYIVVPSGAPGLPDKSPRFHPGRPREGGGPPPGLPEVVPAEPLPYPSEARPGGNGPELLPPPEPVGPAEQVRLRPVPVPGPATRPVIARTSTAVWSTER